MTSGLEGGKEAVVEDVLLDEDTVDDEAGVVVVGVDDDAFLPDFLIPKMEVLAETEDP